MSDFSRPIFTIKQGKAFIKALEAAGKMFHLEDDPATIGNVDPENPSGPFLRLFTDQEAKDLRNRVSDLYKLNWPAHGFECPISFYMKEVAPNREGSR